MTPSWVQPDYCEKFRLTLPFVVKVLKTNFVHLLLLLAPLPLSPWLEPYHAVPLIVGASLLLAILIDDRLATGQGAIALTAVLGLGMIRLAPIPFAMRGIALLASFLVMIGALAALRPKLAKEPLAGSKLS